MLCDVSAEYIYVICIYTIFKLSKKTQKEH